MGGMLDGFFFIQIDKRHYPFLADLPSSYPSSARAELVQKAVAFLLSFSLRPRERKKLNVVEVCAQLSFR